jgi:hypothetical protein
MPGLSPLPIVSREVDTKRAAPKNRPLTLLKGPRPPNPYSRSLRSAARSDKLPHPLRYSEVAGAAL